MQLHSSVHKPGDWGGNDGGGGDGGGGNGGGSRGGGGRGGGEGAKRQLVSVFEVPL